MDTDTLTIEQASAALGLSGHTLRYDERAGLVPSVGRAGNGHRRYTDLDLRWLTFVTRLRSTGIPVTKIRRYTELAVQGESTVHERLALLVEHWDKVRDRIAASGGNLRVIEAKIPGYQGILDRGQAVPDCAPAEMRRLKAEIGQRFCQQCGYRMPCPQGVLIPGVMYLPRLYSLWGPERFFAWQLVLKSVEGAAACVECGECEQNCPSRLPIREMISEHLRFYRRVKKDWDARQAG